eukprot:16440908-Heterocapsa_arctica.AAC.1
MHGAVIGRPAGVSASLGNWTTQLADSILDGLLQQQILEQELGSDIAVYANDDHMINVSVFPVAPVERGAQASAE